MAACRVTRPEPPARTLCCPICGGELGVMPRQRGLPWSPQQRLLVHMLHRAGLGPKLIARVFGPPVTAPAITDLLHKERAA